MEIRRNSDPKKPADKRDLRVRVSQLGLDNSGPENKSEYLDTGSDSSPRLQSPIMLVQSNERSPSVEFDKITQLPTPVLNQSRSGTFPSFTGSSIDVPKVRNNRNANLESSSAELANSRVISEYRPISTQERSNNAIGNTNTISKRFVSDPIDPRIPSSQSSSAIPSPPLEASETDYGKRLFEYSRVGKSYKYVDHIGSGNFSEVILASAVDDDFDRIAIKIISVPHENKAEVYNFKSFVSRELNVLYNIHHRSIIHLLDYNVSPSIIPDQVSNTNFFESGGESEEEKNYDADEFNDQLLFFNYCAGGNLYEFQEQNFKLKHREPSFWKIIERVSCELLDAVSYLHQHNIVHRDIKLENVLLQFPYLRLKQQLADEGSEKTSPFTSLTDFGLSKRLSTPDEYLSTRCGSRDYVSPEVLLGIKYNGKLTDAWSVGVLIYALMENRLPFDLVPYVDMNESSGVSPSTIKRRRARNGVPHRIAMIDWDWFTVKQLENDPDIEPSIKTVIANLKHLVECLLVRKDRRLHVESIVNDDSGQFHWVHNVLKTIES